MATERRLGSDLLEARFLLADDSPITDLMWCD